MSKTGLYSILNVDETTTPAELLDKYRRAGEMRIALDDVEFREREKTMINWRAYFTLRHKPTRKLYDSQGLTIVELENMASTLAYFHFYYIEDFVAFVGQLAPRALPAFMSIFNFGIYVDVAVFLVLVGLKIDSNNPFNHSWAQVFIPLWVIDGIGLAIAIYSCYSTRQTAPIKSASFIAHTSSLVLYIMFVLIQVFIVLKLDGYVDWRVMQVLAPFFVWQVLSYLVRLSQSSVTECKAIYLYHGLTEYILAEMAPPIMWIAFAATLADKLDGVHAGKLYTTQIFVPSYVYAALVSAYSFIYWAFASKDSKKRKLPYSLETYLSMLAALAFCVMLAYRLDNWTSISLFYIFIPLFFILGLQVASIFVVLPFFVIAAFCSNDEPNDRASTEPPV